MKNLTLQNTAFKAAIIFGLATILIFLIPVQKAYGVDAGGGPTVSGVGDWGSGIGMTGNVTAYQSEFASWLSDGGSTDYLSFVDSGTAVMGAHLKIRANNAVFTYSGGGAGNSGLLNATNLYLVAKNTTGPDKGRNDTSKTANLITAESCGSAQLTDISFHTNFYSNSLNYAVKTWTSNKVIFRISTACTTTTKINFEEVLIQYPSLTTAGTYSNSFVLTAVDGLP